jgi:hypothetical protein
MNVRSRESFFRRVPFDSTDAFEHVVDARQGRADYHSENPRRLGLDLFSDQRVEPFARGEIDRDVKALLEQSLGRHQVQGVEAPAGESVPADSPYAALAGGSARTE